MKPFRVDLNVQSNIYPKLEYFDAYIRKPINIREELREFEDAHEVVYVYDEELYHLSDWNSFKDDKISNLEDENKLLKAQVNVLSDTNDFHEDLIAEMAMIVYA